MKVDSIDRGTASLPVCQGIDFRADKSRISTWRSVYEVIGKMKRDSEAV